LAPRACHDAVRVRVADHAQIGADREGAIDVEDGSSSRLAK
jgi:hypothetical protein